MKNYIAAVILITTGIAGTATYYEAIEPPAIPKEQVIYIKIDNNSAKKYTVTVKEETLVASELSDKVSFLKNKVAEFASKENDGARQVYAESQKNIYLTDLAQMKAIGVTGAQNAIDTINVQ